MDRIMFGNGIFAIGRGCCAAALAAGVMAAPLLAQSASDYRLPGATGTPTAAPAGPVDPSDPTSTQPRSRTNAAPPPQIAAPAVTPTAAAPAPLPAFTGAAAPLRTPRAAPAKARPAPIPAAPLPAQTPAAPLPAQTPTTAPLPSAAPTVPPSQPVQTTRTSPPDWQASAAGAGALLFAIFAVLWWRRRARREPDMVFEPPLVPAPATGPDLRPAPMPAIEPAPPPAARLPDAAFARPETGLALTLEARRLTASMMATTLSYAIRVTNTGAAPIAALAVEGDLVSAHASLPVDRQIASDSQRLELRHAQVALAPGESVEFTGDLRLSLAEITPIRAGNAAYFVPLARFRIEAGAERSMPQVLAQTFVIGELPDQAGGALRPFRLDLGPRTYSRVGQRMVA